MGNMNTNGTKNNNNNNKQSNSQSSTTATSKSVGGNLGKDMKEIQREEGEKWLKQGLRNDLGSHVCWHVYGLFHRNFNNYEQAVKCYKSALRIDKENMAILKDLSLLQIQIRDMAGFAESREKIKTINPRFKANWISLAIAKELNSEYKE